MDNKNYDFTGQEKIMVIAEIGTAHQGSLEKGFRLIEAARKAGADCVKFQHVYAREIIHPRTGEVPLPGGLTPLYRVFQRLEKKPGFLEKLKDYAEKQGLLFLCSPFGLKSAIELKEMKVRGIKVASPELNHLPLLEEVALWKIPVILSTGVSTLGDIEKALAIVTEKVTLLHCVTAYPAPEEEYNLRLIPNLREIFGVPTGVSDHSLDPELIPGLSAAMGAVMIEKHFTLSRKDTGLDDPIALPPEEFSRMVTTIRDAEKAGPEATFKKFKNKYGSQKVEHILGTGKKVPAPSEADNYGRTNRSIHALREILPGELFTEQNTALLRTEKILTPGLHPEFHSLILGKKAQKRIPPGEGVQWEHLL